MALSLGFHIIFASISMVLPFFMACAHRNYLKTGSTTHLRLTRAWAKGAAILFATGAVSGTALSFQLRQARSVINKSR
jgi:cytochrome d ubiquinol oxidase subunit I